MILGLVRALIRPKSCWFTGKAANRAFEVINGILNFQIFLAPALYTKNTVA